MKKVFSVALVSLLVVSALIFPLISALAVNSVSWDAYPVWPNQLKVRGYVAVYSYTGEIPFAYINGYTNKAEDIYAYVSGEGSAYSPIRSCNPDGPYPLLQSWWSGCNQNGNVE